MEGVRATAVRRSGEVSSVSGAVYVPNRHHQGSDRVVREPSGDVPVSGLGTPESRDDVHTRGAGVSASLSDARPAEGTRSGSLVWVSWEPEPQAEHRTRTAAHWADDDAVFARAFQASEALPIVLEQARHSHGSLCSSSTHRTTA